MSSIDSLICSNEENGFIKAGNSSKITAAPFKFDFESPSNNYFSMAKEDKDKDKNLEKDEYKNVFKDNQNRKSYQPNNCINVVNYKISNYNNNDLLWGFIGYFVI